MTKRVRMPREPTAAAQLPATAPCYRHTQFGTALVTLLGGTVLGVLLAAYHSGWHPVALAVLAIPALVLLLFHSLTVQVTDAVVHVYFGIGLASFDFALRDIAAVAVVRNRWYYGWGIRITPHGWLYNVSGLDAVELTLASGKRVRIGTDEPGKLVQAIECARRAAAAADAPS
jgi:hypothetical protein